jgi:hypothetical protein
MSFVGFPLLRSLAETFLTVLLISLAGALWWYGVSTNRLAARDLRFLQDDFSLLQPFADAWLLQGNLAYYVDLDPQAAAVSYRQAIAKKPLLIDAWLNLAKVELAGGREDEARRILYAISPYIAHVSTWKWQELLLARDLQEETLFAAAFNFILKRLPLRRTEACFLAKGFWGGSHAAIPRLAEENQVVFLTELMKAKEEGAALVLWQSMEAGRFPPDRVLRLNFCQFLLARGRLAEAKEVWAIWRGDGKQTLYDGGFEAEFTTKGFGWFPQGTPDVLVERTTEDPLEGSYCLHLRFMGTKNLNAAFIYQIIPVEPGKVYRLRFARKSKGLTTDQGVYVNVSGYACQGLSVKSKTVLKRTPWDREELIIPVPAGCEVLLLQLIRNESLMFDNKIAGDYWLDEMELLEWHAP